MYICFSKTPALSPTGDCRPFSDCADGTLLGEGIGMLALKRLADAERDGDRIYAVVAGLKQFVRRSHQEHLRACARGPGQGLRRAYQDAGYGPETVELVEAHGTAPRPATRPEFEVCATVFEESGRIRIAAGRALGSVKSQIGHTKGCGRRGRACQGSDGVAPPGAGRRPSKFDRPDPKLNVDESPSASNHHGAAWVRDRRYPRRASISFVRLWRIRISTWRCRSTPARKARLAPVLPGGKTPPPPPTPSPPLHPFTP